MHARWKAFSSDVWDSAARLVPPNTLALARLIRRWWSPSRQTAGERPGDPRRDGAGRRRRRLKAIQSLESGGCLCQQKTHSGGGGLNSGLPAFPPPSALISALQRCQTSDCAHPLPERAELGKMAHGWLWCRGAAAGRARFATAVPELSALAKFLSARRLR